MANCKTLDNTGHSGHRGAATLVAKAAALTLAFAPIVALHTTAPAIAETATAAPCNAYDHNHAGLPGVVNPLYPDCDELVPGDAPIMDANPHAPIVHPPAA